ncbi:MAG: hypothetical protein EXS36_14990 [Pedosphaera sp.]|nr:hypothetical protein [Pedosphaera sp.]
MVPTVLADPEAMRLLHRVEYKGLHFTALLAPTRQFVRLAPVPWRLGWPVAAQKQKLYGARPQRLDRHRPLVPDG